MGRRLFDGKNYESVVQKLEQAWALGCSDAEASLYADISKAALCEFLKANPKIAERKERLKETPILKARAAIFKAIEKGDGQLALKYLERKLKREFSTLQELSGPDGKPLPTNTVQVYIPHNNRDPLPQPKKK